MDLDNDGTYENSQDCRWLVVAAPNQVLELTVTWSMTSGNSDCTDTLQVRPMSLLVYVLFE